MAAAEAVPASSRGNRRDDLLVAAARRFRDVGLKRTTMEDIARDAGAGKATLYRHFANKDAVIDALLDRETERLERRVRAAVSEADGAADRLEAAWVAAVGFLVDHPVLARGRDEEPEVILPRITARAGPLVQVGLDVFTELIEQGIAAGELREVEARAAAEVLLRLLLSYFAFPPMHVRVDDPKEARRFAHQLVAGSLAAR